MICKLPRCRCRRRRAVATTTTFSTLPARVAGGISISYVCCACAQLKYARTIICWFREHACVCVCVSFVRVRCKFTALVTQRHNMRFGGAWNVLFMAFDRFVRRRRRRRRPPSLWSSTLEFIVGAHARAHRKVASPSASPLVSRWFKSVCVCVVCDKLVASCRR